MSNCGYLQTPCLKTLSFLVPGNKEIRKHYKAEKVTLIRKLQAGSRVSGSHVELSHDWVHVVSLEEKMSSIRGPSHKAAVRNQTTRFFPKLVINSSVNHLLL